MTEKYYTIPQILVGLRKCRMSPNFSKNMITTYVERNGLSKKIELLNLSDEIMDRYRLNNTKKVIPYLNLQKIIDGLQIPIKLSDLEGALE